MHKHTLIQVNEDRYEGRFLGAALVVAREHGLTPNGNDFDGRWVYRIDGEYMDHDRYRSDLEERVGLNLTRSTT